MCPRLGLDPPRSSRRRYDRTAACHVLNELDVRTSPSRHWVERDRSDRQEEGLDDVGHLAQEHGVGRLTRPREEVAMAPSQKEDRVRQTWSDAEDGLSGSKVRGMPAPDEECHLSNLRSIPVF